VKVACSFSLLSVTTAFCCWPPEVTKTFLKSISAAFTVIELVGSATVTSIDSWPEKVAALRSGVRLSA
jgi:hypothetical protein